MARVVCPVCCGTGEDVPYDATIACHECGGEGVIDDHVEEDEGEEDEREVMEKEFDLEQVYDEQINPLMSRILEICKQHEMPMVASFCFRNTAEEGEEVCTSCLLPEGLTPPKYEEVYRVLMRRPAFFAFTIRKG